MTWAANVVPGNARNTFLIFLAATVASVPMAASVTTAFDDGGPLLAIPLALITVTGLTMVIIVAPGNDLAMRAALRYSIPVAAAMVVVVIGSFLDDQLRVAAWILGPIIFLFSAFGAGGGAPSHWSRHRSGPNWHATWTPSAMRRSLLES